MVQDERYIYFPRGYRIIHHASKVDLDGVSSEYIQRSRNETFLLEQGDTEVDRLYQDFAKVGYDTRRWQEVSRIIRAAIRLIPDFEVFMDWQRDNPYLDGMNYEFLHDIGRFLSLGRRDMEPMTALSLMEERPQIHAIGSRKPPQSTLSRATSQRLLGARYIEIWLAQRGGVEDVMKSLYILFGSRAMDRGTFG